MEKSNKEQPVTDQSVEQTATEQVTTDAEAKEEAKKPTRKPKPTATTEDDALQKEANQIFEDYPNESVVYMTSDGFGFFGEHDAHLHAARLADKDVVTVNRK